MHYLSQRAASTSTLQQVLERRAKRRLCVRTLEDDVKEKIERTIAGLVALGLINDETFARNRAAVLARKGLSRRAIARGLEAKGIRGAQAQQAIGDDLDELAQARRYAERKRLGAFRRGGASADTRLKDLRAMARGGFSLTVARRALEPDDE